MQCVMTKGCLEADSFQRRLSCAGQGPVPESELNFYHFLLDMVNRAAVGNPGYPLPFRMEEGGGS